MQRILQKNGRLIVGAILAGMSLASLAIAVTLTLAILASPALIQVAQNKSGAPAIVTPLGTGPVLHLARGANDTEEDCVLVSRGGATQPHRLVCAD